MTIIKTLLAGLFIVPLAVSMAVAGEDIGTVRNAETIAQKPILRIKPIPDAKTPRGKRVIDRAEITQSISMSAAARQRLHIHNEVSSAECYAIFGDPPVIRNFMGTFSIDCNYYGDFIESE